MKESKQFGLLMWKHGHLRKHRWFLTLVEIFLPILLAYLFCSQASKYVGGSSHRNATIERVISADHIIGPSLDYNLLYAPKNNFTERIMNKVRSSGYKYESILGFSDELELLKVLSVRNSSSYINNNRRVGIVFLNTEGKETNPTKMTYKLRDTNHWKTELLFPEIMEPGPYRADPYYHQGLAGVQMIIDAAYIQQWDPTFNFNEIKYQAFPYPEYDENTNSLKKFVYQFICYIVIATTLILSAPLIRNIIEEKESGVKELMKLAGVSEWLIQFSWFFNALMFSLFSFTIVSYLLQYDFEGPGTAVLLTVPVSVIWTCIILYCVANITFCFTVSSIFHSATVATSIFTLVFFLLAYASSHIAEVNSSFLIKLMCIFPIVALSQGFQRIAFFEQHKIPFTWSSLSEVEDDTRGVSLLFIFLMLIFDTILYLLLTYYISCINPGTFGSKKSPLFFLENLKFPRQMFFWFIKMLWPSSRSNSSEELIDMEDDERKFYEDPPKTLEVSIQIKDLNKRFGSFVAVKNLNLKVYKGEITALLGHNGAGKSTTMGILTGMLKATTGSITYDNRIDVLNDMSEFRQNLGMCPQEDRLFPYLSVVNHLYFFGMLKGGSKNNVLKEADSYLRLMEMKDKENELSPSLSGGMKRKLCLAIALMGNSQTLILDEPTSGMDVESRRKIWDLLLDLRGTRTIILSTHHMEEADVLGDRIAIMHHGSVVCHGTSLFLKKVYDTGYKVTIIKTQGRSSQSAIMDVITKIVPSAKKESESETEIVYNLPLTESAQFPELFQNLESDRLGIQNIGVACTTMEQVFLKVGGASIYDIGRKRSSTVTDGNLLSEHSKNKKTGLMLRLQQFLALLWKKYLYTKRNIINFCYRVIIPSVIIVFLMYSADAFIRDEKPLSLSLSTYPNAKVMMTDHRKNPTDLFNSTWNYIQVNGDEIIPAYSKNIIDDLLNYGRQSLGKFQRELLLAANLDGSTNLALYNKFGLHSLPVLINTLSNVQLGLLPGGRSIETINSPVKIHEDSCKLATENIGLIVLWFTALVFFTIDISYFSATFVSMERIDGFKHIQLMSNVSSFIYWFSNLIFDSLCLFAIVFVRIVAIKLVDDAGGFLNFSSRPYYVFLLLLWGFIISGLLFSYVINFISNTKEGSYTILFISSSIGVMFVLLFYAAELFVNSSPEGNISGISTIWMMTYYAVKYLILLIPPLNYSLAFIKYAVIWYNNAAANQPTCPSGAALVQDYLKFSSSENLNGLLLEVIFMLVNIILYSVLLAVIEAGYLGKLLNAIIIRNFSDVIRGGSARVDTDVEDEKKKVDLQTKQLSENVLVNVVSNERNCDVDKDLDSDSDANETVPLNRAQTRNSVVIAKGLKKVFVSKTFRPFVAVEDVNFIVNSGECFGLLGVNGAGKSTTFKMLTAVELPTRGDSFIYNIRLAENKTAYLSRAGYCAQTNCFIEELTGREMLTLIASLRGVRSDHLKRIVDKWLAILGLESYQNRKCGRYSGGNKRKLCTAMSLIGDPSVVFLDEPTTGVDPVSRRKLYDVMDHSKMSGQAVVLTSHSMEECENLCDRLTIMSKGRMKCIGTAQHLKQRYAQGFSILIKTHDRPAEEEKRLIGVLKNNMNEMFGQQFCVLKDEHKGLLYYQITNVELRWSEIFGKMEKLKLKNDIVEDYTVTDTTLEEVFISFAKQE